MRHEDFLEIFNFKSKTVPLATVSADGFQHYAYSGAIYLETTIGRARFASQSIQARYCYEIDPTQHRYSSSKMFTHSTPPHPETA